MRGETREGLEAIESALERSPAPDGQRAWLLRASGLLVSTHGQYAEALERFARSIELYRASGDRSGLAQVLCDTAFATVFAGDLEYTERLLDEATLLASEVGDRFAACYARYGLGVVALSKGDARGAADLLEASIAAARQLDDQRLAAHALSYLAVALAALGAPARAAAVGRESLTNLVELGDAWAMPWALLGLAAAADRRGESPRVVRLLAAGESLRIASGAAMPPVLGMHQARFLTAARQRMGQAAFDAEWSMGASAPLEQMITYALAAEVTDDASTPRLPLTRRELEVATLIGRGLTSREIADALVISVRTADTHADHIRDKLGLRSRVEIATWAIQNGARE